MTELPLSGGIPTRAAGRVAFGRLDEVAIQLRYAALDPVLDERGRRRFAAAEARSAGWGGVSALSRIIGMARSTIVRGLAELR